MYEKIALKPIKITMYNVLHCLNMKFGQIFLCLKAVVSH